MLRAQGHQPLRPEKSWRPTVSVVVDQHQCYEVNLGCDGQNPNLRERFMMFVIFLLWQFSAAQRYLTRRDANGRSQVDINVYHQASSKKKRKKRYLVAKTSLSLQALSKLKGTAKCKYCALSLCCPWCIPAFKIPLSPAVQPSMRGLARGRTVSVFLIARLEVPETPARFHILQDSLTSEDKHDDDIKCKSSLVSRVRCWQL